MTREFEEQKDPCHHARKIRQMLSDLAEHARQDAEKVDDPKAQVLFETTAEVLQGLATAYQHYETGAEKAMR